MLEGINTITGIISNLLAAATSLAALYASRPTLLKEWKRRR
jgi:hypothetical protein